MTDLQTIKEAVKALPRADLAELRGWLAGFDGDFWDAQIEGDLATGKLDALLAETAADFEAGNPSPA